MKTVIFGGGFDPPHRGHERVLKTLLGRLSPDRIIILPSGIPPHKALSGGADGEGRMAMCRAAFGDVPKVVFSDFDLKQEGKCYTLKALEHFKNEDPKGELFLYVGTDQLLEFETWYCFEDVFKLATLLVMSRYADDSPLLEKKQQLERDFGAHILFLDEEAIIISSTEAREEIARRGFSEYLSPGVNEIVTRRGFYHSRLNDRRGAVLDHILASLDEERLTHTLGMERETVRLSEWLCYPTEKIRLAALLHDLTRRWSIEQQIAFLRDAGEELSEADLISPVVLHGRSAALMPDCSAAHHGKTTRCAWRRAAAFIRVCPRAGKNVSAFWTLVS